MNTPGSNGNAAGPQKYLITGGAGFVGSHLVDLLLDRGDEVTVIDDLSTGSPWNLARHAFNPRLRFYKANVADRRELEALYDKPDVVYHLAAAVGVSLIMDDPLGGINTNIEGTRCVLDLAAESGAKVVFASTSEVYGKSTVFPFREDGDVVLGPSSKSRWSYAASKLLDEFYVMATAEKYGNHVVIVRLFNTVGPRQVSHYGMVIPRFIEQALKNEPMTVYGDGKQSRCFTHVSDVVGALAKLPDVPETAGEVFNIGGREEVSMRDLAEKIRAATGSRSEIRLVPYDQAYGPGFEDMARRVPDLGKIERTIAYHPRFSLDDIIRDMVADRRNPAPNTHVVPVFTESRPSRFYPAGRVSHNHLVPIG